MEHAHNYEKQTILVVIITALTMVVEVIFGLSTKSMYYKSDCPKIF